MSHDAAHNPANPVLPIIGVLGVAALGGPELPSLSMRCFCLIPQMPLFQRCRPVSQGLVKLCGSQPDAGDTGFASLQVGWMLMVVAMMLPPRCHWFAQQINCSACAAIGCSCSYRCWRRSSVSGLWLARCCSPLAALRAHRTECLGGISYRELGSRSTIAAGVAAISVGLFEFTQLKMACMDACRSPRSIMITKWRSAAPARSAFHIGMLYGMICFGCCWAMMVLGVLVGALMLPIMVICAVMMALERLLPASRPLIPIQAGFAILIGALLLAGSIPTAFN